MTLTIGELREAIKDLPDDSIILGEIEKNKGRVATTVLIRTKRATNLLLQKTITIILDDRDYD